MARCHRERISAPRTAQGARAAGAFSPSPSPRCRPRPRDAREQCLAKSSLPAQPLPLGQAVSVLCPLAGRAGPGSPLPGRSRRLAPAPRPHAHAGKVNDRTAVNEV